MVRQGFTLGSGVDADNGTLQNAAATADGADEDGVILSLPDAIGRCLERAVGAPVGVSTRDMCPGCGALLVREEGCMKCLSCGYAKC